MQIDLKKKYRTRSGLRVELWAVDMSGTQPVVGRLFDIDQEYIARFYTNGSYELDQSKHAWDLIEVHDIPEGFIPWHGGECPVAADAVVEYILKDKQRFQETACNLRWDHIDKASDIIAYSVIEPTYRPFASAKEFMPYRDRWLRWKSDHNVRMKVDSYSDAGIWQSPEFTSYQYAFAKLEFENGEPFGIKETDTQPAT